MRYLFIDDAATEATIDEKLGPLIDNVESGAEDIGEELQIDPKYPAQFDDQITIIRKEQPDGLILDLRLDEFPPGSADEQAGARKTNYRATGLAQEIRTRATEENMGSGRKASGEFPLVLWSYDGKLRKSFTRDDTGHDLFDMLCRKEELEDVNRSREVARKLIALCEGYEAIAEIRSRKGGPGTQFYKFVGFRDEPSFLDPRLLDYFSDRETPIPVHEYARFILKQLLMVPGPLIEEDVLAARLGVDLEASEGWSAVLESVSEDAKYRGPFQRGWSRWWAFLVERWWESQSGTPGSLRRLEAEERVSFLNERFDDTDLKCASPIEDRYSTKYWTVCQGSDRPRDPLDPIDGFRVDRKEDFPWQEETYISEKRALEGAKIDRGLRVDPLERDRLEELKARRSKGGQG